MENQQKSQPIPKRPRNQRAKKERSKQHTAGQVKGRQPLAIQQYQNHSRSEQPRNMTEAVLLSQNSFHRPENPYSESKAAQQTNNKSQSIQRSKNKSQPTRQTKHESKPTHQSNNKSQPIQRPENKSQTTPQAKQTPIPTQQSNKSQPTQRTDNESQTTPQTKHEPKPTQQSNKSQPIQRPNNKSQTTPQTKHKPKRPQQTKSKSRPIQNGKRKGPSRGEDRYYGIFRCKNCRSGWTSAHVYTISGTKKVLYKQQCETCRTWCNPYDLQMNECRGCGEKAPECKCICEDCGKLWYRPRGSHAQGMTVNQEDYCSCDWRNSKDNGVGEHIDVTKHHRQDLCSRCKGSARPCDGS